ncbi:hypothetical protein LCGC14_0641570 [marine sediment metagenome]|uniref:Uncharacterized protein n=1 Tax=marine sediment metagenome TaxID=412755 RepID=A0A0F9RIH8_9ZZZZ
MNFYKYRQPHRYKRESKFWKIVIEYGVPIVFGLMTGVVLATLFWLGKAQGIY